MESKVHQMICFQSEKCSFIGINSEFQYTLICRNPHSWKLKSSPKSYKSQNRSLNTINRPQVDDFAPIEDHCYN